MLKIMLCGASDTEDVVDAFIRVTASLGGEPWHYQSGRVLYLNNASASWDKNSRRTVGQADLCVFVILRRYGEITWNTELREALDSGKPFLILCLDSTKIEYFALKTNVTASAIHDPSKRLLVEVMTELLYERQLTMETFTPDTFAETYRQAAASLFGQALDALQTRSAREALSRLLGDPSRLSNHDLAAAEELATDEFEDKNRRKLAISALLSRSAASSDTVLALLSSREQGVQRFAVANLDRLYAERPADQAFLEDCVVLANESDDTGVVRRLIPALFEIDLAAGVRVADRLDLSEIGTRRRLAAALEEHELAIRDLGLVQQTVSLLEKCLIRTEESGWIARCRSYTDRLRADDGDADNAEA